MSLWSRYGLWHGAYYDEWGRRRSISMAIDDDGTPQSRADAAKALQAMQDEADGRRGNPRARTRPAPATCIYFVRSGAAGPIKIGVAQSVERRLKTLQTGCPEPLSLIATMPGSAEDERRLHERFADLRLHGEWFRPGPSLLAFIDESRENSAA